MRALQCLPLALLFLTSAVPTKAQEGAAETRVVVREGAPLTVECGLRVEQRAEWRRDGGAVAADMHAGEAAAGGRLTARLHAAAARPAHAGLYSCGRDASQRVRVVVQPAPAPAVLAAPPGGTTTDAAPEPGESAGSPPIITTSEERTHIFDIGRNFALNCTKLQPAEPNTIVWKKNGTEVEKWKDLENRYELKENGIVFQLTSRAHEDDYGTYVCGKRGVTGDVHTWQVKARPYAKLPANSNVVEGQKIKLQCKLIGKPYPKVTWTFHNGTDETNGTEVRAVLGDRVVLKPTEQGVEDGELVIEEALRSDAGVYTCTPNSPEDAIPSMTRLRVKDMYAALWPFLGICAEVFVLCVIILLYEKRRTKPELDDSDTDNHDQKKS